MWGQQEHAVPRPRDEPEAAEEWRSVQNLEEDIPGTL